MKLILTSIALVILLLPSLALGGEVTFYDLVEREGLYYKKFTDVPFSGKITGKVQGSIKDGKWDGPWVSFHKDGQLWMKGTYKDGNWDGPWIVYWDNGLLGAKGTYKDGKKDGPWVSYHQDGTVDENWTGTFKNSEKVK